MQKKTKKLTLNRETLRSFDDRQLRFAGGGQSIQSGETYCWCTDTCPVAK
jgi:natural product precursor